MRHEGGGDRTCGSSQDLLGRGRRRTRGNPLLDAVTSSDTSEWKHISELDDPPDFDGEFDPVDIFLADGEGKLVGEEPIWPLD